MVNNAQSEISFTLLVRLVGGLLISMPLHFVHYHIVAEAAWLPLHTSTVVNTT